MVEIRGRPSTHGSKRPRRSQGAISVPKPFPGKAALGIAAGTVRLSAEGFACTKAICNYIYDTYGRFPGGTDAMHLMWVMQAHHIDTEYYERFFGPGAYGSAHAAHMATWHQ